MDGMSFRAEVQKFAAFGRETVTTQGPSGEKMPEIYSNEFWTSRQRAGHSLHEVSYRACFKPQLPAFFIERLSRPGDWVYDPFMGRGTTLLEAKLHGRQAVGNDLNPLAPLLIAPRLAPPTWEEINQRVASIELSYRAAEDDPLLIFFHPETLGEILSWRAYFANRQADAQFDAVDAWLQMVCCNRLTGHSPGFFSVYTLPPNQATSVAAQKRINKKRNQSPEYRNTKALILKKSRQLLKDPLPKNYHQTQFQLLNRSADQTLELADGSIKLIVTSPPFLDVVDYEQDNWLRMWFARVNLKKNLLWQLGNLSAWSNAMTATFQELQRVLRPDGWIAFEVGEVRKGKVDLVQEVVRAGEKAGLAAEMILIQCQNFTKTANCWGVTNNTKGTNSNRIVLFKKQE